MVLQQFSTPELADGKQFYLTPGKHNELQIAIINEFGPNFAPGAVVLYVGDAANKFLVYEQKRLEQLGVPVTTHGKLPDVILCDAEKNWLYLVEAVTSHGPVSPKRKFELEQLLQHCKSGLIFVTAFLNGKEFKRHATQIAWETEVWIAEMPEHMLTTMAIGLWGHATVLRRKTTFQVSGTAHPAPPAPAAHHQA